MVLKPLAQMKAVIEGWQSAFSQCDDPAQHLEGLAFGFAEWLQKLGITLEQVKAASDPSMGYGPSDYALGR